MIRKKLFNKRKLKKKIDKFLKYVYDLFLLYSYDWFFFMDVVFLFYIFFLNRM